MNKRDIAPDFTITRYIQEIGKAVNMHPEWRYGQVLFNVLHEHWPKLADMVQGSDLDPFYWDEQNSERLDQYFNLIRPYQSFIDELKYRIDIGRDQIIYIYENGDNEFVDLLELPTHAAKSLKSWVGQEKELPRKYPLREFQNFLGEYCEGGRWRTLGRK